MTFPPAKPLNDPCLPTRSSETVANSLSEKRSTLPHSLSVKEIYPPPLSLSLSFSVAFLGLSFALDHGLHSFRLRFQRDFREISVMLVAAPYETFRSFLDLLPQPFPSSARV